MPRTRARRQRSTPRTVDGGAAAQSKTNVLENAIPGLRADAQGGHRRAQTISVGEPTLDREAIKTKIKAFVTAYNDRRRRTRASSTEKPVADPTTTPTAGKGQLFGDVGLQSMLSRLREKMTDVVAAAGINDLSDIGIAVPKATGGVAPPTPSPASSCSTTSS